MFGEFNREIRMVLAFLRIAIDPSRYMAIYHWPGPSLESIKEIGAGVANA